MKRISLFLLLLLFWTVPWPSRSEPSPAELHKIQQLSAVASGSLVDENMPTQRVPRVYVIGAQKGGSSSLYEMIIRHPALCGAMYKEPNFFLTNIKENHDLKWYLSLFIETKCLKKPRKAFVDGSCMLHGLHVALKAMNSTYTPEQMSSLRFIALLREPVARDYSWYKHRVRAHLAKGRPFSSVRHYGECFRSTTELGVGSRNSSGSSGTGSSGSVNSTVRFDVARTHMCHVRGEYLQQLRIFTQYFRRDQILMLNSQTLFSNDPALMPAVAAFLGVKMSNAWLTSFPKVDHIAGGKTPLCLQRYVPALDCATRDGLGKYYAPKNLDLMQWLNESRSRGEAHPAEPPFAPFAPFSDLPCVDDAQADYDKSVAQSGRVGCTQAPGQAQAQAQGSVHNAPGATR